MSASVPGAPSTWADTSMNLIAGTTDRRLFINRIVKTVGSAIVVSATVALLMTPRDACAQLGPLSDRSGFSKQYYLLGGNDSGSRSVYKDNVAVKLGLNVDFRFNYSCGKFDIGFSITKVINGINTLGDTISTALSAGVAALPLYILQRAQPGLYEVFQTYSLKAQALANASLKTCEEIEQQIKTPGAPDPYLEMYSKAKSNWWRNVSANATVGTPSGDIVEAKYSANKNNAGGNAGISWIWGGKAGGADPQEPVKPIEDLTRGGYLQTLNINPSGNAAQATTNFSNQAAYKDANLVKAFPSPKDASDFSTEVLGDIEIVMCDANDSACQNKKSKTAVGLLPRFDKKVEDIKKALYGYPGPGMTNVVGELGKEQSNYNVLKALSSPGMPINDDVIQAIRQMPPGPQRAAGDRLAQDIATSKVINEALVIRNLLMVGLTLPDVAGNTAAVTETKTRLARLETYIEQLLFEARTRKELSNQTALTLLGIREGQNTSSLTQPAIQSQLKSGSILGNAQKP